MPQALYPHKLQQIELDLEDVPGQAKAIHRQLIGQLTAVRDDEDLTKEAKATRAAALREKASEQLAALKDKATRGRDSIAAWQEENRGKHTGSDVSALLTEQRIDRTWRRLERQLDAGTTPGEIVARAKENKDLTALRALQEELPAYAGSSDKPSVGIGIDETMQVIAAAVKEAMPPGIEKTVTVVSDRVADTWAGLERAIADAEGSLVKLAENPDPTLRKAVLLLDIEDTADVTTRSNGQRVTTRGGKVIDEPPADDEGQADDDDSEDVA